MDAVGYDRLAVQRNQAGRSILPRIGDAGAPGATHLSRGTGPLMKASDAGTPVGMQCAHLRRARLSLLGSGAASPPDPRALPPTEPGANRSQTIVGAGAGSPGPPPQSARTTGRVSEEAERPWTLSSGLPGRCSASLALFRSWSGF